MALNQISTNTVEMLFVAVIAAIIVTPWYANAYGAALAPAWIVILLDAITIGSDATVRASIPLIFSIIVAELIATTIYLIKKI